MTDSAAGRQLFGQPIGLATLFLTEMWERFTYYGMRAILILLGLIGGAIMFAITPVARKLMGGVK